MKTSAIVKRALVSGTVAAATSTVALALRARAEGRGAAQPLNATSHWLYGPEAADFRDGDVDHTIVGFGTHHAATIFWALFFEASLAIRPTGNPVAIMGRAATIATLAAIVDYTITPRRFTPGWELVVSKRSMALTYAAMAAGFAGTAIRRRRAR